MRWELHRVWVVEATLKPGKRHIYAKRTFYLDEDSWTALAADQYDAKGRLYRASFAHMSPSYDAKTPNAETQAFYDLTSGVYNVSFLMGPYGGVHLLQPAAGEPVVARCAGRCRYPLKPDGHGLRLRPVRRRRPVVFRVALLLKEATS